MTISLPPEFIPPPMEDLAIAEIADQKNEPAEAALFAFSNPLGVGWCSVEARPLSRDRDGAACALVRHDFWPRGAIMGFDDNHELVFETGPFGESRRMR